MESGTLNNLNDVYKHHCDGEELDKESREVFVKGSIEDVNAQFQVRTIVYAWKQGGISSILKTVEAVKNTISCSVNIEWVLCVWFTRTMA